MRRAQEGAGLAEFFRLANAFRWYGTLFLGADHVDADAFILRGSGQSIIEPARIERSGQQEIDGDIGMGD